MCTAETATWVASDALVPSLPCAPGLSAWGNTIGAAEASTAVTTRGSGRLCTRVLSKRGQGSAPLTHPVLRATCALQARHGRRGGVLSASSRKEGVIVRFFAQNIALYLSIIARS